MNDLRELFERQAAWQKQRVSLTWAEKIRMAAAVREWAAHCSKQRHAMASPTRAGGTLAPDAAKPKPFSR